MKDLKSNISHSTREFLRQREALAQSFANAGKESPASRSLRLQIKALESLAAERRGEPGPQTNVLKLDDYRKEDK